MKEYVVSIVAVKRGSVRGTTLVILAGTLKQAEEDALEECYERYPLLEGYNDHSAKAILRELK